MDIKSMILKKKDGKESKKLMLKDVNRSLVTALLAIQVYGKDARDEEILSIIINPGTGRTGYLMKKIREHYEKYLQEKKVKKTKDGIRDSDGYMILVPKK